MQTLSTRVAVVAGVFTLVSVVILSSLLIRAQRRQALAEVGHGSENLAGAVALSIHRDMQRNHREGIQETLEAVGRQEDMVLVRLYNKDGVISFSSDSADIGVRVPQDSAFCASCHTGPVPAAELPPFDRSRVHTAGDGDRWLSTIHVVRNESGCQGSGCHAPAADQPILGVLQVGVCLGPVDERLAGSTRNALLFALFAAGLMAAILFALVRRSVRAPISRMVQATRSVVQEHEALPVPRGAAPELGILAKSFNEMVETLTSSNEEMEEWALSLQEQVAAKARELREARFQIVQAEKLSSVGLVAAGIAHELNSPLMAIITFTHLVRNSLPADAEQHEDLNMIEREAKRCAGIIRHLLDYSRKQTEDPDLEPVQIEAVLDKATELLQIEIDHAKVRLVRDLPADLPMVNASSAQLEQVFVNLIMNAVHAMPEEGGRIEISARVFPRSAYKDLDLPPHTASRLLEVSVYDTGTGIPRDALGRVFDPFFTTKPVGQGSGLGLSVSLGLIRSYRGTITVDSDGESWTRFNVYIPIPDQPALAEAR